MAMPWTSRFANTRTSGAPAPDTRTSGAPAQPREASGPMSLGNGLALVAERHRRRRNRRLASWAVRTAEHVPSRGRLRTSAELLIPERVEAVRSDLLEIAAVLEHLDEADRASTGLLHKLLSDGCDSPLYNADLHVSELQAALYYVKKGLTGRHSAVPAGPAGPAPARTRAGQAPRVWR